MPTQLESLQQNLTALVEKIKENKKKYKAADKKVADAPVPRAADGTKVAKPSKVLKDERVDLKKQIKAARRAIGAAKRA